MTLQKVKEMENAIDAVARKAGFTEEEIKMYAEAGQKMREEKTKKEQMIFRRRVEDILLMCDMQYKNIKFLAEIKNYEGAMLMFRFADIICPELIKFLDNPDLPTHLRYPCFEAGMKFEMYYGIITGKMGEMKKPRYSFEKWCNEKC